MGKTYRLDLRTLLDSLTQQTATLSTELRKGLPAVREPCTGYIYLERGRIMRCVIIGKKGMLKEGQDALQLLQPIAEWHVELRGDGPLLEPFNQLSGPIPIISPKSRLAQVPEPRPIRLHDDQVPRQCIPLLETHIQTLAAKDRLTLRTVLVMVDGRRSIRHIKEALQLSPQTIEQILEYLRQLQIIEI